MAYVKNGGSDHLPLATKKAEGFKDLLLKELKC